MKIFIFILFTLGVFVPQSTREWSMYPNPAKDHIIVEVQDGVLPKYIVIYNMNGVLVQKEFVEGQMSVMIQLRLRPGMYIVYLEDK